VVDPADIARFAELEVTANCQALWACNEAVMTELTVPVLGETRSAGQYPFGAIHAAGGRLAFGSDWPVSSPDPLAIVQTAVTRTVPADPTRPVFHPEQRLDLAVALTAATAGSAYVNRLEHRIGHLRTGFAADLTLLDRDPFTVPATEIDQINVTATLVEGTWVHRTHDVRW
jgi:predicted amidohydrolase YtcJ